MAKKQSTVQEYGAELGAGIKQGLQGLNTVCSPKKRKTCIRLIIVPLFLSILGLFARGFMDSTAAGSFTDVVINLFAAVGTITLLGLGVYQFYVGKVFKGIVYTVTCGGFLVGCLIDLFKLVVTKTFKDANGFPLIY